MNSWPLGPESRVGPRVSLRPDWWFESSSLQQQVACELDHGGLVYRQGPPARGGDPAGSTASVTTASSPTPTGPITSHWPAGSSGYQTRLPGALTAIARTVVTKTKSGIFVLAAMGVWSPSRPSNPAASRDCGPVQQSASTAHDQHAPVAIPHCRASSGRCLTGDGFPPPTATVSADFHRQNADRSLQHHRSDPAHGDQNQRCGDYSTLVPVRNRKIRAYTGAKSP